jgi:hypothetical protein
MMATEKRTVLPKTRQDLMDKIQELFFGEGKLNRMPIVFIDECLFATSKDNEDSSVGTPLNRYLRFVRKALTTAGIVLVLLGTDSRITHILETVDDGSRGSDDIWCYVVTAFPKVPTSYFEEVSDENLKMVLKNSRPWFSMIALSEYNDNIRGSRTFTTQEHLQKICKKVFQAVTFEKKIFDNCAGRLGQLRMFLAAHHFFDEAKQSLIHSHFAKLHAPFIFSLKSSGAIDQGEWDGFEHRSAIFIPTSLFPNIGQDVLLFLSLMGGEGIYPFQQKHGQISFLNYTGEVMTNPDLRTSMLNFHNPSQRSNDGMQFEAFVCAVLCLSSHMNGFAGIEVKEFLKHIVYNFQKNETSFQQIQVDFSTMDDLFSNVKIPFLSPPNTKWPEFLKNFGNFENLKRTRNCEQIDARMDLLLESLEAGIITAEVKDFSRNITKTDMTDLLPKIPKDSFIHLVFVRSLQEEYTRDLAKGYDRIFYRLDISSTPNDKHILNDMNFGEELRFVGAVIFVVVPE